MLKKGKLLFFAVLLLTLFLYAGSGEVFAATVKKLATSTKATTTKPLIIPRPMATSTIRFQMPVNLSINGRGDVVRGNMNLSGPVVNSISGGIISASSTVDGKPVFFTIKTDSNTITDPSSSGGVVVGSVINVQGNFESFSQDTLTMTAKNIRSLGVVGTSTLPQNMMNQNVINANRAAAAARAYNTAMSRSTFLDQFWGFVKNSLRWK
ncbi:MAG: hypothetical protein PHF79_03310 [Candidatus Pacebacteria bacterium]|nr:hypothetical protein [Candidatus Paceibacterota bacterium]